MSNPNPIVSSRRYGDLIVFLQYYEDAPAMTLTSTNRNVRTLFVIPMNNLHRFIADSQKATHSKHLEVASIDIASRLGLTPNKRTLFNIAEAIIDNIDDVIKMPPHFAPEKHPYEGTITAKIDGKSHTIEI